MSATYNWAYKPGIANKYGITIDASDDNSRPDNTIYVALFGNDTTGNGSRKLPYRTITKGLSIGGIYQIILGSGVYREAATMGSGICDYVKFFGDGDVKIDISYIGNLVGGNYQHGGLYNLELIGNGFSTFANNAAIGNPICQDVVFNSSFISPSSIDDVQLVNCIVKNFSGSLFLSWYGASGGSAKNCTFVNINNFVLAQTDVSNGKVDSCVFKNCNISGADQANSNLPKIAFTRFIYSLFFQCNFNLTGNQSGGVLYPAVPSGYELYTDIATLQADFRTSFGTNSFQGCSIADPLFNNDIIGDYTLQFASPAKNLSFFGTYIGARSIAYPISASGTEATGSFDFSSKVNLNVANNSITLIDQTIDAQIDTKLIVNNIKRVLKSIPIFGFNADRNGQYIDSIPDLATTTNSPSDTLPVPASYLVETAAIIYNGISYQPGDRFTTIAGQTSFTTGASGVIREILEAPERHTVEMRSGDGSGLIAVGAALTAGNWYYVESGSVTYGSNTYTAGQSFKAINTVAFTGSGSVTVALSTEAFNHFEPGIQPSTNNTGDVSNGSVLRGNGDPAYVRGGVGVNEFYINNRFIQIRFFIRVNNLKP